MSKRIFFAINLPPNIKKEIFSWQDHFSSLDDVVKWVPEENLHITLDFVGALKEEKLQELICCVENFKYHPFKIKLKKISYFPPSKKDAKMIWVLGVSRDFEKMVKELKKIRKGGVVYSEDDTVLHITLGRIRRWDFRKIDFDQIPSVSEVIDLQFLVDSFDLMESKKEGRGVRYKKLKTFYLQKNER